MIQKVSEQSERTIKDTSWRELGGSNDGAGGEAAAGGFQRRVGVGGAGGMQLVTCSSSCK